MDKWYTDSKTDDGIIISSRVRLARNIKRYPFLIRMRQDDAQKMINETVGAIINDRTALSVHFNFFDMKEKLEPEKRVLLEKHIISPEFFKITKPKGLLLQDDEKVSIMLNEEDHVRIQSIYPGDNIDDAWDMADKIDDLIEETVEYAFDKDYGYLTSCPTNTGTGLRASFMMHLPMLDGTGYLKSLLPAVSKFGMTLRGIYGEGTEPMGGIYQLSNQVTMGKSEAEILTSLKNVASQIMERETTLREKAMQGGKIELEDKVYRSYGILKYARKITAKEAMHYLSDIRLGFLTGIISEKKPKLRIYNIMMNIQPGSLQAAVGRELGESERDTVRAEYIKEVI